MKTYVGIDIGGMTVKGMIIDEDGVVLAEGVIETGCEDGGDNMCNNIAKLIDEMFLSCKASRNFARVGVGCPGLIDSKEGVVVFAGNLGLKNYPLVDKLEGIIKMPVKITNDANAAALGEAKFGAGKEYSNSILITLGTGVGGGIVLDGKLFEGNKSAGAEIGHMVIERFGSLCTCGRRGCFEVYCSATALIKKTREVMEDNPGSRMWEKYTSETATGRTAFDYYDTDIAAKEVIDWYEKYLACGIANLANIFRPEVIMLGGGVSKQGENLSVPVQKLVDKELFGGTDFAPVKVVTASLGSKAGAYGAAALAM